MFHAIIHAIIQRAPRVMGKIVAEMGWGSDTELQLPAHHPLPNPHSIPKATLKAAFAETAMTEPRYVVVSERPDQITQSLPSKRFYAGIGSRETPADVRALMHSIGFRMARAGWTLRSGGAGGADQAFEAGCDATCGFKEIYLPWRGFNGHPSRLYGVSREALELAAELHPNWAACSTAAKCLHARNCYQILGASLDRPVEKVLCWTRGARGEGGTGQALRLARRYNIPVFDLADPAVRYAIEQELSPPNPLA